MHNAVLALAGPSLWLETAVGLSLAAVLLVTAELLARRAESGGGHGRPTLRDRSASILTAEFARE